MRREKNDRSVCRSADNEEKISKIPTLASSSTGMKMLKLFLVMWMIAQRHVDTEKRVAHSR